MMSEMQQDETIPIDINGETRAVRSARSTLLIHVLRNDLGLAGTRFGCGTEQCGSCVVLADGRPICSCTATLGDVEGKRITTVEGLARGGELHPLQQAFLDEQAAQCGYCLSGILMRAAWLLEQEGAIDEARVREALEPHLCRCGSHNRIVRAVLRAARSRERAP